MKKSILLKESGVQRGNIAYLSYTLGSKSPIFHLRPINEERLTIKQSTCNWLLAGLYVHFHVQRLF